VLRKHTHHEEVIPDKLPSLIENEVHAQLDELLALDDKELPLILATPIINWQLMPLHCV